MSTSSGAGMNGAPKPILPSALNNTNKTGSAGSSEAATPNTAQPIKFQASSSYSGMVDPNTAKAMASYAMQQVKSPTTDAATLERMSSSLKQFDASYKVKFGSTADNILKEMPGISSAAAERIKEGAYAIVTGINA